MRVAGDEPERVWTVEERITSIAAAELRCLLHAHPVAALGNDPHLRGGDLF